MRLIDADNITYESIDSSDAVREEIKSGCGILAVRKEDIDAMPTIEERKKGKWIEAEVMPKTFDVNGIETWASKMQCDQCGFITYAIEGHMGQYNFCPNCGADMRGGNHETS